MEFRQLGGSGFNAYLSLLAPAGFRGAKSVAGVSEGSSLCLGGAHQVRKGWSLRLRREKAKAGAFAYNAQPPDDEVRFRRHRLTNASVR
jgi:hypothetical protein